MYFRAICSLRTGQSKLEWNVFIVVTPLAWTTQSVNCHIDIKVMFYVLINSFSNTIS